MSLWCDNWQIHPTRWRSAMRGWRRESQGCRNRGAAKAGVTGSRSLLLPFAFLPAESVGRPGSAPGSRSRGAKALLAPVGPGDHRRGVRRFLRCSAVARGFATPGPEAIDGTFDELAQGEQGFELVLVVAEQRQEGLAETAGALSRCGHRHLSPLCSMSYVRLPESDWVAAVFIWRRGADSNR